MNLPAGVLTGQQWQELNVILKEKKAALPAVCVSSTGTANAAMAAAAEANSPIIILASFGGGYFNAGKTLPKDPTIWAAGAESIARHIKIMAPFYGVPVIVATDHCSMENLPWLEKMLEIDQAEFDKTGSALWSGHMADLSASPIDEALPIYKDLLKRHADLGMILEFELGETGGEEDGVTGTASYTSPEECSKVYGELIQISDLFTAALTFGNVHGVYKGNFDLRPDILGACQAKIREEHGLSEQNPMDLVFHGGSGCTPDQMKEALEHGTIKQNIDTDTQWAFSKAIVEYVRANEDFLNTQVGNSSDPDAPNKKKYDPRVVLSGAEKAMTARILESYGWLNGLNVLG